MEKKISTIVLSDDNKTKEILGLYLKENALLESHSELFDFDEVYNELSKLEKSLLLIDVTDAPFDKLDFVFKVTKNIPSVRVVALSDNPSVELIVQLLRSGVKEFVPLPIIKSEFTHALKKVLESFAETTKKVSRCKIISVFSNKGGIGKTSIASNLALELAKITKEKVALIDLNFQLGDITTFMDLRPAFNISYMLQNLDRVNEEFLLSTLEKYKNTSLYVLADPPFLKQAEEILPKQITKLFNILKDTFSYIVVDAESSFDAKNISALTESDIIFLVTIANLPALRSSQRCLELFEKLGFDKLKCQVLLNRYMENDEIKINDVESLLKQKIYWRVPNNYFTMMSSINKGIPVCEMNSDSNVAKSYRELAMHLTDNIYKDDVVKKFGGSRGIK